MYRALGWGSELPFIRVRKRVDDRLLATNNNVFGETAGSPPHCYSHRNVPFEAFRQPMAILQELAHAYHDQVLGTDEPRIRQAWAEFRDSKRYNSVLVNIGQNREHYGLVNHQEFFAEMTETYFGENDFFPFVAGELERTEPEIFALMCDIWGPLPSKLRSD